MHISHFSKASSHGCKFFQRFRQFRAGDLWGWFSWLDCKNVQKQHVYSKENLLFLSKKSWIHPLIINPVKKINYRENLRTKLAHCKHYVSNFKKYDPIWPISLSFDQSLNIATEMDEGISDIYILDLSYKFSRVNHRQI